jgi:hypothetical protein
MNIRIFYIYFIFNTSLILKNINYLIIKLNSIVKFEVKDKCYLYFKVKNNNIVYLPIILNYKYLYFILLIK